jgi:GNAT superfamily N-acetyltransferase
MGIAAFQLQAAPDREDRMPGSSRMQRAAAIEVWPFDPHGAAVSKWAPLHAFRRLRAAEDDPGEPLLDDAGFEHDARRHWPLNESRRLIARLDGEIVGSLAFAFRREGTPDHAAHAPFLWAWGGVRRGWRRRAVATALLGELLGFMQERGKTIVGFGTQLPEGHAFLAAVGAEAKHWTVENRLLFAGLDWDAAEDWRAAVTAGAGLGWEVHAGRVPLHRLEALYPQFSELFADVRTGFIRR